MFDAKVPVTVSGEEVPLVDNEIDGVEVVEYDDGVPPVAAGVNGIDTVVLLVTDTDPMVGASGTSAIGVTPAMTLFNETLLVIVT